MLKILYNKRVWDFNKSKIFKDIFVELTLVRALYKTIEISQFYYFADLYLKLDVIEKNACLPPPPARSSVRAVEGRKRTTYDRFETKAFIKVRRTCTYIYMNINKGSST